jgi:hypothetical protein
MSYDAIDAVFDEAHEVDFNTCPPCQVALDQLEDLKPSLFPGGWRGQIKNIHESSLRTQALVAWLLKPSPPSDGVVTYYIEGTNPMTQPALPMTVEAAEIALTRELGFRLVGTTLEAVNFAEEDVATVEAKKPADPLMQRLWSAAVSAYVSLGNAEQRERELLVQLRTLLRELDSADVASLAADQLRVLLDGE